MSIGFDETMLEAKRFLHLQRKSTPWRVPRSRVMGVL